MKKELVDKLWKSSNAVHHFMFKKDSLGMAELTTPGIIVSYMIFLVIFVGAATLLGGF